MVRWCKDAVLAVLVCLVLLAMTGCATQPEVRVVQLPEPPVIVRPTLPTEALEPGMPAGKVLELHREAIVVLQGYARELEAALNAYRKSR